MKKDKRLRATALLIIISLLLLGVSPDHLTWAQNDKGQNLSQDDESRSKPNRKLSVTTTGDDISSEDLEMLENLELLEILELLMNMDMYETLDSQLNETD